MDTSEEVVAKNSATGVLQSLVTRNLDGIISHSDVLLSQIQLLGAKLKKIKDDGKSGERQLENGQSGDHRSLVVEFGQG